jgi:hypothetical protein
MKRTEHLATQARRAADGIREIAPHARPGMRVPARIEDRRAVVDALHPLDISWKVVALTPTGTLKG